MLHSKQYMYEMEDKNVKEIVIKYSEIKSCTIDDH